MPVNEFLTPGVFPKEGTPKRAQPSLSPSIGAFVGWTEKGPSNEPISFESPLTFRRRMGDLNNLGLVAVSVDAYFDNGGQEVVVVRTVPSDAVAAQVTVDPVPAPGKWTFIANGEGIWGNDLKVLIRGNQGFLNTSVSPPRYDKFDVLVLEPSVADPNVDSVAERVDEVQFTDPTANDYFLTKLQDVRFAFTLINVVEGLGGEPAGLATADITDEVIGTTQAITATLASPRVLEGSVRIVASETQVDDETQAPAEAIDSVNTSFTFTLPTAPILDGSLRLFFDKFPTISNELVTVTGAIDGVNTVYTVAALALSDSVSKETAIFRLKYADVASASGPNNLAAGVAAAPFDLSTTPIAVGLPIHPGTLSISVTLPGPTAETITDDGAGGLVGSGGSLPGGGTIDYDTGAMTGITASLEAATSIDETHNTSSIITKAATTDNLALGVALAGAVAVGTIDLVDSVTTPTGSGPLSFTTSAAPLTGTSFFLDFVQLGIIESDLDGVLTGDVGVGTNTVDQITGAVDVETSAPPLTGSLIQADYQTGQVVTDDGLGGLEGDVDAAATNTINYDTGEVVFTLAAPPLGGTDVLANYSNVPREVQFDLSGGLDGSGVARADISDPALEASGQGIYALDRFEQPYNLAVPDFAGVSIVQTDLENFAKDQKRVDKMFLILAAANGLTPQEVAQYFNVTLASNGKNIAAYYPNVQFRNDDDVQETLPASIFANAVYARTAERVNVGKTPAGVEDGALTSPGVIGLERKLSLDDRGVVTQARINVLRNDLETGPVPVVWDGITTSTDPRWTNVNTRQLHMFLIFRIKLRLNRFVQENNGPALWLRIEEDIRGFMDSLFRDNFFGAETPDQAYQVVCSKANNDQSTIDAGVVRVEVGFTAGVPGRFIDFTLTQPVGQPAGTTL